MAPLQTPNIPKMPPARRHLFFDSPMPPPLLMLELALLGLCTGYLAGLLGIGGGMVMVPFLTMVLARQGYAETHVIQMAVATSLATICFTSLSSVRAHHQRGAVLWPVVRVLTPGILAGAFVGAQIAAAIPTRALALLFSVFVAFSATQMLRNRKPRPSRTLPGTGGMVGVGGLIGVVSALLGAGGAFLSVPFMVWCNVGLHQAVGTAAALGFPIALAGTLGYVWAGLQLPPMAGTWGYLYLPGLVAISLMSVLVAPWGARTAHAMDVAPLKRVFAVLLYGIALYFALR